MLFVNGGTPWKLVSQFPPLNFRAQIVHFWSKIHTPPCSDGRCAETRNSEKTRTTGITTISMGYPHIHIRWNSVPGIWVIEDYKLCSAFWLMAQRFIGSALSRNGSTYRIITNRSSQKAESMAFRRCSPFGDHCPRFLNLRHYRRKRA